MSCVSLFYLAWYIKEHSLPDCLPHRAIQKRKALYELVGLRLSHGDSASKAGQDHKKEGHVMEEVIAVAKL